MKRHSLTFLKGLVFILSLLFLIQIVTLQAFAQTTNKWYVDKSAKGTNTGKTVTNAWTSFANIGWSSMADGDTLFISGGADSTVYNETLTIGKGNITIARMTTTGHNGKVIIDGQSTRDYGILNQSSYNSVIIDGVDKTKFIIRRFLSQGIRFRYNGGSTIKNFTVELNDPNAFSGVFLFGGEWQSPPTFAGTYTIENFSILQDSGSYAGSGNSDGIQMGGVDGVIIRNGYIRLQNADNNPHSDGIQAYHCKNILIEQNQIYQYDAGATASKQGIYITDSGGKIKIRNNYIYHRQPSGGSAIAIEIYDNTWWTTYAPPDSFIVTNNTVDCKYDNPNAIRLIQAISSITFSANTILKNNILIEGGFAIDRKFFTSASNCDYNIYYEKGGAATIYDQLTNSSGSSRTWATWQSNGFDIHSYTTDPLLKGYMPASTDIIDKGADLSGLGYSTDIEGKKRPQGIWSIGAYQYSSPNDTANEQPVGNLKANVKVFLEGSYNGSSMTTALPDNEVMPDIQPYSAAPWNYNGSESFNAVPDLTVDWILVELRSAENPAQVVSTRAGLLKSDGRIMEPDGTLGVTFKNILYGYYYIAILHRNHLSVMSSSPVLFSPDNDLYDFTTSISKAYGPDGMAADTANGVFMMYSGDGNGNGIIDGDDYDGVWSEDNGKIGYLNGDFNLDSGVNSKDSREFWNNGKSTKVP